MYSDELLIPWLHRLAGRLPGARLFDAHTHLGEHDSDGSRLALPELVDALRLADAQGVAFPLMEPDGYRDANSAVIEAAEASDGRLVAFCRLDPRHRPVAELERCCAAGARGVKLHPRAEHFDLRHAGVRAILAAAAERRLPVVVHSGLGIPSLGRDALALAERHPEAPLVLAHVAEPDLAWIWRRLGDHPSLFLDTAWWNPADHVALFSYVPPGHILFGSDAPYGTPVAAAVVALASALGTGLSPAQTEAVTGGQLRRLLAGELAPEALDLGPAPGPPAPRPPLVERVFTLLVAALSRMLAGAPADDMLELARLGCNVDDDEPEASALAEVAELLGLRERYAQARAHALDGRRTAGFHLVLAAAALAASPGALADLRAAAVPPQDRVS